STGADGALRDASSSGRDGGGARYLDAESSGVSGGAVAGIVIGVLAGVAIMGAAGLLVYKRRRERSVTGATHVSTGSAPGPGSSALIASHAQSPSYGPAVSTLAVSAIVVQAADSP